MQRKKRIWSVVLASAGLGILILDSRSALTAAAEGIQLCISTVIPSLFPFFVISALLTAELAGHAFPALSPLERLLGMPAGSASLFLVGLLGGYPVGARSICQAFECGQLKKADARRMLGFCNNAGPAFLFGMCGGLFSSPHIPWILWMTQIFSAIAVGCILPGKSSHRISLTRKGLTLSQAMNLSLSTMAQVCGWVVLFRVILTFLQRWFFFFLPQTFQICLTGFLELSNGCVSLKDIASEGLRFILCSGFLSFGGVCVSMQTLSVTQSTGSGLYFPGKILQLILCVSLSLLLQPVLFSQENRVLIPPVVVTICLGILTVFAVFLRKQENKSSNLAAIRV